MHKFYWNIVIVRDFDMVTKDVANQRSKQE